MPWFPIDPPEIEPLPIRDLDLDQARRLHQRYVEAHPARLQHLRDEVPARGGPSAEDLSADFEGLRRHWEWWLTQDVPRGPTWDQDDLVPF